jgi:hypothetical protein
MYGKYKTLINIIKIVRGNSLAEFAVVSALMATLAATAAPKLSALSETAKAEKSKNELDKLLTQARTFYQKTQDQEGRGRFPGQEKFDRPVGNYGTQYISQSQSLAIQTILSNDLDNFTKYSSNLGAKWRSVFGISNLTAPLPPGAFIQDDIHYPTGAVGGSQEGTEEWLELFGNSTLFSTYQDGHFIYVVVPGGGSGDNSFPPVLYVADLENPSDFHRIFEP